MFSKTMEFCNKGMVWADPLPPSYGQRPYFYIFFLLDPSLTQSFVKLEHFLMPFFQTRSHDGSAHTFRSSNHFFKVL